MDVRGTRRSSSKSSAYHRMKMVGAGTEPCGRPAQERVLRAARSVNFSADPTVPQEAEHPLRQALWEGPEEFQVEHLMIDRVVCPTEIEGKEDELVGDASVLRSASGLRAVPAVLYRLDKPG